LHAFILQILENMGTSYSDPEVIYLRSPALPLQVRRKMHRFTDADFCGIPYTETRIISFLGTMERFVGVDTLPLGEDKKGSFDLNY
jgi:hypothetical protein